MALQILPAVQKRPSFASQAGAALMGAAGDIGESYVKGKAEELRKGEQKEAREKENAALLRQGYDLQDIEDPETRKQIIANTAELELFVKY